LFLRAKYKLHTSKHIAVTSDVVLKVRPFPQGALGTNFMALGPHGLGLESCIDNSQIQGLTTTAKIKLEVKETMIYF